MFQSSEFFISFASLTSDLFLVVSFFIYIYMFFDGCFCRDPQKLELLEKLPLISLVMLWQQRFHLYLFPSRIQNLKFSYM